MRVIYFEWMLFFSFFFFYFSFRQRKEENPARRWKVWKGPQQTDIICVFAKDWLLVFCFLKEINNPLTKKSSSPPALATFHQPLQPLPQVHSGFFVVCLKAAQLSVKPWVVGFFF